MGNTTELNCNICGKKFTISSGWYNSKNKDYIWRCKSCRIEHHKNWYKNLSNEERINTHNLMSKSAKERWHNMGKSEYTSYCKKLSDADRKYWNSLSDEEYNARCISNKLSWDNRSNEYRKAHGIKSRNTQIKRWESMDKNEKELWRKFLKDIAINQWRYMNDDELNKRKKLSREVSLNFWRNMTELDYYEWKEKQRKGFERYYKSIGINPNKNENDFMDILKLNKIDHKFQYINANKHQDFDKLFPYNPIMKTDRVSPYHRWDFIIHTKEKDVLVDIEKYTRSDQD